MFWKKNKFWFNTEKVLKHNLFIHIQPQPAMISTEPQAAILVNTLPVNIIQAAVSFVTTEVIGKTIQCYINIISRRQGWLPAKSNKLNNNMSGL